MTDRATSASPADPTAAARGGILLIGRFVVVAGLNYAFALALAWVLPPAEFGTVAVLQMTLWLAAMTVNSGFPWTLSWTVALRERGEAADTAPVFRTSIVGNLVLGAGFGVALLGIAATDAFRIDERGWALTLIVAAMIPILALNAVGRGALHGSARFARLATVQVVEVLVKVVIGIALVAVGLGAEAVALGFVAGAVVAAAAHAWFLRDLLPGRGPLAPFEAYRTTIPMFATAAGFGLLMSIDVLGLRAFGESVGIDSTTIAHYQVAVMLASIMYFIGDALADAVFPFMVTRAGSSARSHRYLATALRWVAIAVIPLQVVLVLRPEPVVDLLFPTTYLDAVPLVRLLALGSVGTIGATLFGKALQAVGRRGLAATGVLAGVVAEVVGLVVLVPSHGAIGTAWASFVSAWAAATVLMVGYVRTQRARPSVMDVHARYALALAPLVGASLLAPRTGLAGGCVLLVALVAYGAGLLALRVVGLEDLRRFATIARRILPSRPSTTASSPAAWPAPAWTGPESDGPDAARSDGDGGAAAKSGPDRPPGRGRIGAIVIAAVAVTFLVASYRVSRSPDTLYDEVVYTRAAQNAVTRGEITWSSRPVFVHPPLYFLVQGQWLRAMGKADAQLLDAFGVVRVLNVAFFAGAVGVTVAIATSLMRASARRRVLLGGMTAALAAFDPLLLRFGRLGMIEPMALFVGLLTVAVAWWVRHRSWRLVVPLVGLLGGVALLVKELTIVLLLVPLVFGLLSRAWPIVRRSVAGLAVAVGLWLVFPAWAASLGLGGRFFEEKFLTLKRLLGTLQVTGWNRPTVSFIDALATSAGQYLTSYVVLAAGAAVLMWLWLKRSDDRSNFLIAWLACTYGFATFTVARGQLNEQFFAYVLPGAIVATVLGADAVAASLRPTPSKHARRRGLVLAPILVVVLLILGGVANWGRLYATGRDDAIRRMVGAVERDVPECAVMNVSGDLQKYLLTLGDQTVTNFGSGPQALSRGVRYFFLNTKDVFARYGRMSPDLAEWIRANGRLIRDFESHTYWRVQLWQVHASRFDPFADVQPVVGGFFVNTNGSACGGYRVVNRDDRTFFDAYQRLGGKPRIGRPVSSPWVVGETTHQAFDTLVLSDAGRGPTIAVPIVERLAATSPGVLAAATLPIPTWSAKEGMAAARELVVDPSIARAYLGVHPEVAGPATWNRAIERWGAPLGPARTMADGLVRQPFQNVVFEQRSERPARLSPNLSRAVLSTALVPESARRPQPVPGIGLPSERPLPSDALPFVRALAVALGGWLALAVGAATFGRGGLLRLRRLRRPPPRPNAGRTGAPARPRVGARSPRA